MGIEQKTTGMLIDELITTVMKCFFAQETLMTSSSIQERSDSAIKAQVLNARRNKLIVAIDKSLGRSEHSPTYKTYEVSEC